MSTCHPLETFGVAPGKVSNRGKERTRSRGNPRVVIGGFLTVAGEWMRAVRGDDRGAQIPEH